MYKRIPNLFTCVLITLLLCKSQTLSAQPNPISNFGFEASSSSLTGWNTSNHAGTSSVANSKMRTGLNSFSNNYSNTATNGYIESNNAVSVPANQYLVLIAHYQVTARNGNSRVQIGVSGNMGSAITPAANNTYYQISNAIQNTTGSVANWKPRFNMYSSSGTQSRIFYWDDIIAYVSSSATVDLTSPNTASNLNASFNTSTVTLNWQNGSDNAGGSGVQRTIILRTIGDCSTSAPVLNNQVIYSKAGGYGENIVGSWTVIDTVSGSATSYTDNTISNGTGYVYAIVHEDKAYNHSTAITTVAPVFAITSPTAPTNGQTNVSTSGLTLSWPNACGASSYRIYFSTNQADVNNESSSALLVSSQTGTSYNLGTTLSASTIYYWKVVPVSSGGSLASGNNTWSFTTTLAPLNFNITRNTNTPYYSIVNSGNMFSWSGTYNADDKMSDALNLSSIGFNGFSYQGLAVTDLEVNTNGFVTFNLTSNATYTNNFSGQRQIIAPFWEDLVCQGYIAGASQDIQKALLESSVKYLVTGQQGNQVLTIEWSEMEIYNNAGPSINFQLKLYEQDDRIEFVYGRMFGFNGTVNYTYSYSVGLSASTVSATPTAGQLVCQQLANVLNFSNVNTNNLNELPDCYSTITFVPNITAVAPSETTPALTNDNCNTAIVLPIQNGIQNDFCRVYSSKGATASSSIPVCNASTSGTADDDVWFKFTVTNAGAYGITVNSSGSYNAVIQLFSGNCNTLTNISCTNATGNGLIETLTVDTLIEGTYFVRVYDANTGAGGSGNFAISVYNIINPPTNDDCVNATELTIGNEFVSGNTANARTSIGVPACTAGSPGTPDDDVWFKFTATSTITRLTVNGGSAYNAVMQYFTGTCGSLTSAGCVSSTGAAGVETLDISTTIGTTYFIRVYHSANGATPTTGFSILASNVKPSCPTLTAPTNNINNVVRTNALTFSWSAAALPTVGAKTYRLQISTNPTFTDTLNISAAQNLTTTSYNLPANTLSASTTYYWRVIAQNANGNSEGCNYFTLSTTGTVPSCARSLTPEVLSSNIDTNLTLTWAAGSGTPTSYSVFLSANQSAVASLSSSVRIANSISTTSHLAVGLQNNTTYYWTVIPLNGSGSATGCYVNSFTTVVAAPINDNCSGAVNINPTSSTPILGTVLNATQSMVGTVGTADDDVWYKFTAASTAHNISVSAAYSFNAVVELFSGACGSLTSLHTVNANGNGMSENLRATGLTVGQTYYVRVYDFGSTKPTSQTFNISINDVDMGISSFVSPTQNNCGNTTVTVALTNYSVAPINFSVNPVTVSASVLSPANVTTSFNNVIINSGTLAAGATQQVNITTTYQVINAGAYTYTATATTTGDNNEWNNSTSATLQQIELPAPFILSGSGSYCVGSTGVMFALSGSEEGTTYQLFRSQAAVSGIVNGTGSSLTFPNVNISGSYRVVATSNVTGCASYMSASSVVEVTPLWLGVNTDWNNTANWCGGVVPPTNANIIISGSAVNMPVLPGNITVNNLELTESNKRIELNGKTLTINGAISGEGTVKGSTTSSIVINGSGNMGTLKMDQTTNGVTNALQDLTINVGSTKTNDSIVLGNTLNLNGTLTLNNGKLNANGNLVLVSNATSTARVAAIANTADIVGNVVSQRFIPAVTRRYRMISPNTSSFTYNDIKDDIFVTGSGGATNGFDPSNPNSASIYTYRETTAGGRGWVAVTNINQTLNPAYGAIVFVRGDRTLPAPQWYTFPFVAQNQVNMDFVGPVNKGTYSPTITFTNTGVIDNDGWNLVGNPYPSQIDWSLVNKTNLTPFVYSLDPTTNAYVVNDGIAPIASGQGFFVKAIAANPTITFTEDCKTGNAGNGLFKTGTPIVPFKLKVVLDSLNSDYTLLRLRNGSSMGFNEMEDAVKLTNTSINFGFKLGNSRIHINTIPQLSAVSDTFVLFMQGNQGNFRIEASNFNDIPANKQVLLKDMFTNVVVDLRATQTYNFSITSAGLSQGDRFQLIITNQNQLPVDFVEVRADVVNNDIDVKWSTATEVNNDRFVVEKSYDNKSFTQVGTVKGAVNSKVKLQYNFNDELAAKNAINAGIDKVYYRINQIDISGKNKYSNTVVVRTNETMETGANTLSLFPNPASKFVSITQTLQQNIGELTITDITGKVVYTKLETGFETTIDISSLQSGVYFVKGENTKTYKLVVE